MKTYSVKAKEIVPAVARRRRCRPVVGPSRRAGRLPLAGEAPPRLHAPPGHARLRGRRQRRQGAGHRQQQDARQDLLSSHHVPGRPQEDDPGEDDGHPSRARHRARRAGHAAPQPSGGATLPPPQGLRRARTPAPVPGQGVAGPGGSAVAPPKAKAEPVDEPPAAPAEEVAAPEAEQPDQTESSEEETSA